MILHFLVENNLNKAQDINFPESNSMEWTYQYVLKCGQNCGECQNTVGHHWFKHTQKRLPNVPKKYLQNYLKDLNGTVRLIILLAKAMCSRLMETREIRDGKFRIENVRNNFWKSWMKASFKPRISNPNLSRAATLGEKKVSAGRNVEKYVSFST